MVSTENRYLELIPAGVPTRHPADIAAADVPRLLRALRESDRTVVLDCPPVVGVAETTILVTRADAVILVVDARKFSFEDLEHGLAQIRASGGNVVGIVLNRVRRRKTGPAYGYDEPSQNWSQSQGQSQSPSTRVKPRRLARSG
jgi:Mrp family chromosome partitioning ATPase